MAWAFDDEEPEIWVPSRMPLLHEEFKFGCNLPHRILDHIEAGGEIRAWNAQFERIIWREIMVKRYGAPEPSMEQYVCSAAEAAAMSLPRHLAGAAQVLGVEQQKDDEGYRLMLRMTRPRKIHEDGRIEWWDVPEKLERLYEYCKQDVRTERSVIKSLRRLTPREREIYLLDQRINDRGARIDRELVVAAQGIVADGVQRANDEIYKITQGAVEGVTSAGTMRLWLGVDSIAKDEVKALLESELPDDKRRVLEIRAEAGRSSVAKLDSMLDVACTDDRVRGLLLYHGAGTGRWTGKLLQPQNFPRGEVDDVESFIPLVMAGDYDAIDIFHHPIVVVSSMLRSMITAAPGYELISADFSAIEARVLNWLAGQDDIVALFRRGEDVYKYNAARLFQIPLSEVKKFPHRQTGKFQELGCGFGMGAKKAVSAANTAQYGYLVMTEERAKEIVDGYRSTHRKVVSYWYECNDAAIEAVNNPGVPVRVGPAKNVTFIKAGAYLYIVLPSGRPLAYAAPKVVDAMTPWGEMKPAVEFSGVDRAHQWGRMRLYGGLIVENIVQAAARDFMAEAMLRVEAAGYGTPTMSVHDEIVNEVPEGYGSLEEFESIMRQLPAWGEGCPVATEGWRGFRYRK